MTLDNTANTSSPLKSNNKVKFSLSEMIGVILFDLYTRTM